MAPLGVPHDLLARALVFVVLTGGALAALAALLIHRPAASPAASPASPPAALGWLVDAAFAGVVAGVLALAYGGPGALAWLLLAALVGGALQRAELHVPQDMSETPGPVTRGFRVVHALAATLAALTAGGLLLAQQAAEATRAAFPLAGGALAAILAFGTAVVLLARPGTLARGLASAAVVAVALYVGVALWFLLGDRAAASAAVSEVVRLAVAGDAALGGLLGVAAHGVLRAAVAGTTGGLARAAAPAPWRGSLVAGGLALLTGLVVLTADATHRVPVADRGLVSLEPNLRTALIPSDFGQMIAVNPEAGFLEGQRYPVVLRADPRGHRLGQVFREENVVAVPAWDLLRDVDTVILRDKDPARADNPGFDLRIAVTQQRIETPRGPFFKLAPVDPDINFRQLMVARDLDGPFLNFHDYPFVASVARGFQLKAGDRLALYEEPRLKTAPPNPTLRDLVTLNFAGPYPDRGEPTPPQALVAAADTGLQPGTVAHLRLTAPDRGLDLGFLNRLDELEVPAWSFLAACDTAVLRHKHDPSLDREIRVTSRFAFGRLRFSSPDVSFENLATAFPEHTGPHLRPPDFRFAADVHSGARLPSALPDASLALVPVHMHAAPTGNPGWGIYDPHPGEVLATDMVGPFLDEDGAATVVRSLARKGPAGGKLAALALLVLAVVGLAAWARAGVSSARRLFGPAVGPAFALVFLVCVLLGPGMGLVPILHIADVAVAVAVLLGVAALLAGLPLRRS